METLQDVLVGGLIISIMGSVGLDLTPQRLARVFRRPTVLVVGLSINHLGVPLVAFGVSLALGLPGPVAAGLLLCAAAPGGPVGTLLALHARGDLALSVSLVVVMTLLDTVATPVLLSWFGVAPHAGGSSLGIGSMAQTIALFQLLPLIAGMTVRRAWPGAAVRFLPWATRLTKAFFALVFVGMTITQAHRLADVGWLSLLAIEACIVSAIGMGLVLTPGGLAARATVALNGTVRHLALGLLLASLWFDDGRTILTVMTYGLLMLLNGVPLSMWLRGRLAGGTVVGLTSDGMRKVAAERSGPR